MIRKRTPEYKAFIEHRNYLRRLRSKFYARTSPLPRVTKNIKSCDIEDFMKSKIFKSKYRLRYYVDYYFKIRQRMIQSSRENTYNAIIHHYPEYKAIDNIDTVIYLYRNYKPYHEKYKYLTAKTIRYNKYIDNIPKTKEEIWKIIEDNSQATSPIKSFIYKYNLHEYENGKLLEFTSVKEIYDYIFPNAKYCNSCKTKETKFISIARGYQKSCSKECQNKLSSDRMKIKENNPRNILSKEEWIEVHKKQSEIMKKRISAGEFTPCVTNSWSKSKIWIDKNPFRSSWDAYFYLVTGLPYEKIRIKYYNPSTKKHHIYIVDFHDDVNKILYEIKPFSNVDDNTVKIKEKQAIIWCKENGYKFCFIHDDWFIKNYDENIIKEHKGITDEYKQLLLRRLSQFNNT